MIKGYAKRVPEDELVFDDKPLWYLPHHPVFNPNKPGKTRVVFDCTAKFRLLKWFSNRPEVMEGTTLCG